MKPNETTYDELRKKHSPNSNSLKNCTLAYIIGGLICVFGQFLGSTYMNMGIEKKDALTLASVTLIFISALSTGLGLFGKLAKHAGAGTLVPITGFANAITSPALEFKSEGYIGGLSSKLFIIAGPVITYGLSASIIYGVILFLFF